MALKSFGMPDISSIKSKGNTIIAAVCKQGVVLAIDTRPLFLSGRNIEKFVQFGNKVCCIPTGDLSDSNYLLNLACAHLLHRKSITGVEHTVKEVAGEICHCIEQDSEERKAIFIVAGYCPIDGPELYVILENGTILRKNVAAVGPYAFYVKKYLKQLWYTNMPENECRFLVSQCLMKAFGVVNSGRELPGTVLVKSNGVEVCLDPNVCLLNECWFYTLFH